MSCKMVFCQLWKLYMVFEILFVFARKTFHLLCTCKGKYIYNTNILCGLCFLGRSMIQVFLPISRIITLHFQKYCDIMLDINCLGNTEKNKNNKYHDNSLPKLQPIPSTLSLGFATGDSVMTWTFTLCKQKCELFSWTLGYTTIATNWLYKSTTQMVRKGFQNLKDITAVC